LPERYILFAGVLEPKKNIPRLLQAYSQLIRDKNISHQLVIAGKKGWKYEDIFKTVASLGIKNNVRFLGFAPAAHLPALYAMAELFAFPSLYEGFGLPVLEAMASGCPVVTSNSGALPEIAGDPAHQTHPTDVNVLAENMRSLLTKPELRHDCIQKGLEQAAKFSWQQTANAYLKVYKSLGEKYQLI
jgi:glycosyltransferase involved in cell wall biosynthesis